MFINWDSWMALVVKNLPANAGDIRDEDSIPGLGRFPGVGHSNHSSILAWRGELCCVNSQNRVG